MVAFTDLMRLMGYRRIPRSVARRRLPWIVLVCLIPFLQSGDLTTLQLATLGMTASELNSFVVLSRDQLRELILKGCCLGKLCNDGFHALDLRGLGCCGEQLKICGFSGQALRCLGVVAWHTYRRAHQRLRRLKAHYAYLLKRGVEDDGLELVSSSSIMKAAQRALKEFTPKLKKVGQLLQEAGETPLDLLNLGFSNLEQLGFESQEVKEVVHKPQDLLKVGFSLPDCLEHFSIQSLRADGITAKELKKCGTDAKALRAGGFSVKDLRDAGFPEPELKGAGFTGAGFSREQIWEAGNQGLKSVGAAFVHKRHKKHMRHKR